MKQDKIIDGVQEFSLESWKDFFKLIDKVFAICPAYIYRGQACDWPIKSSLDRLEEKYPKRKNLGDGVPSFFDSPPFREEEHL